MYPSALDASTGIQSTLALHMNQNFLAFAQFKICMVSGANVEPWLPFNMFFFNILHLQLLNNWLLVTNPSNPFYLHQDENN